MLNILWLRLRMCSFNLYFELNFYQKIIIFSDLNIFKSKFLDFVNIGFFMKLQYFFCKNELEIKKKKKELQIKYYGIKKLRYIFIEYSNILSNVL